MFYNKFIVSYSKRIQIFDSLKKDLIYMSDSATKITKYVEQKANCSNPACTSGVGLKKCSGCKVVRYCSKKCQKNHWKISHRFECRKT